MATSCRHCHKPIERVGTRGPKARLHPKCKKPYYQARAQRKAHRCVCNGIHYPHRPNSRRGMLVADAKGAMLRWFETVA